MSGIVKYLLARDKPALLATARVYIDTIEVFARTRFSIELKNALRKATGRRVWDEPTLDGYGWILFVNQPTPEAIQVLEEHWTDHPMWLSAVHVAIEFDALDGVSRDQLVQLIDYHFHIKRRRSSDRMFTPPEHPGTLYSVDTQLRRSRGQRKASKIGVAYHDKPGKLDGELDKPRYEIRIETSRAIGTMGFHTPIDLFTLKPRDFLAKVLVIKQHWPTLEMIIQRSVDIENAKPRPTPNAERRIWSVVRRAFAHTLSGFASAFPDHFKRIQHWDAIDIDERLHWVPRKGCERVGDELSLMSHVSQATIRPRRERLIIRERL